MQAQIIALDVLRGQALNPSSRIARQLALPGRIVQTRDERRERVIDRLRCPALLRGEPGEPGLDRVRRELRQLDRPQRRQPMATVDVVVGIGAGLEVGAPVRQSAL